MIAALTCLCPHSGLAAILIAANGNNEIDQLVAEPDDAPRQIFSRASGGLAVGSTGNAAGDPDVHRDGTLGWAALVPPQFVVGGGAVTPGREGYP
jgi:hypothetical protein